MTSPCESNMAASVTASSHDDPFKNLEMALVDLTKDLLPGYAVQIQSTNPSELKPILSDFVAKSLPKPLKDKHWPKCLITCPLY